LTEPAPLVRGYWPSLWLTIIIYIIGLQSWPLYMFSWFLSYYSWFSSVYYVMLSVHPFFYTAMLGLRGRIKLLWAVTTIVVLLNFCVVAGWFVLVYQDRAYGSRLTESTLGRRDWESELSARISLMYYLFPPGWFPSFALGTCAAFLFDHYRPYESHYAWVLGAVTDLISVLTILTGYILYPLLAPCRQKEGLLCPSIEPDAHHLSIDDQGLDGALGIGETDPAATRALAGIWSRFLAPVMVIWLFGLAAGKGGTAWLFTRSIFVDTLAPISYYLYLFHQWVGQMYYLTTRKSWWSYWRYRKSFFWFSPAPVPVGWWEYFFVLVLTTLLSKLMARLDPYMIQAWGHGRRRLRAWLGCSGEAWDNELSTIQVVLHTIEQLTGVPVEADWTLAECGLASVAGPVVISRLQTAMPGVTILLADLTGVDTVDELAKLLDKRVHDFKATGVGTL